MDNKYKGFYENYFHMIEECENEDDFDVEDFCFDFLYDTCDAFCNEELNRINLEKYLHGYCVEFAMMLSKKYGYEIVCLYNSNELIHAYCIHNGLYIDVRGITNDYEIFWEEFDDFFDWEDESMGKIYFTNYKECYEFFKKVGMEKLENQEELEKIYLDEYTDNYYLAA